MLRYVLVLLAVSSPSDADTATTTKGCKLVVRDFDGPTKLADTSRGVFMKSLGLRYELVPQKRWDAALDQKPAQHGVRRWQAAARRARVNAVVESWIQDEGRRHTMSDVDSVSVKVSATSVVGPLDDVLEWIDCTDPQQIATPLIF